MKRAHAVRPNPRDEKARQHLRAAQALERAGNLRGAADEYRIVCDLQPRNVAVLGRLGEILRLIGETAHARRALERAVKIDPRHADGHVQLGMVRKLEREPERALESFQRAAWADPRDARAHIGMFGVHEQMSRLDEAEEAIRSALAIDPTNGSARVMLARLERRRGNFKNAASMLGALIEEGVVGEPSQRAHFELGRCLEKLEDHDGAFRAYSTANAVQSQMPMARAVDARKWLKFIADANDFTGEHFARWAQEPPFDDGPAPVFLVGFPRSGTTMTEQVLGAHPDVGVSDEHDLFSPMYKAMFPNWDDDVPLVEQIEDAPRELVAAGRAAYRAGVQTLLKREPGATVLVDKSPMNIVALGVVNRVFPEARVIVAMRDPRDVCLSCFFQEFVPNPGNNFFFTPEGTLDMYKRVMDLWLAQRDTLKLSVFESRYETITADFENRARNLIEFLGLPWSDRVLKFYNVRSAHYVSTPSFEAVTAPVHTKAQGKWRRYEQHLQPLLEGLTPYLDAFGYER